MLVTVEKVPITGKFNTNPEIEAHIAHYATQVNAKLDRVVGYSDVDLEARFSMLRS